MNLQLKGKNVIITASTDGIGYATARRFLEEGANILINGRNQVKAEERKKELEEEFPDRNVFAYAGDVTREENIQGLCQYAKMIFDQVDCMVANVGSGKPVSESRLAVEEWEKSFDINLFSTVKLVQAFDGLWNEERGGSIVMLSSLAAYNRISAPYAYAAAKQGISVFSKYLSDDYAKRNIRVNSVVPGNVFYKGGRWEELVKRDETGVKEYIENSVPLKRFASPDEIANAIVFLASDCASFITGTSLVVDGGQNRSSV